MASRFLAIAVGAVGLSTTLKAEPTSLVQLANRVANPGRSGMAQSLADSNRKFLENKGQWAKKAKYLSRSPGLNLWLTSDGWKLEHYVAPKEGKAQGHAIDVRFVGANRSIKVDTYQQASTRTDFLRRGHSYRGVHRFGEVVYRDVYPNTDVRWYMDGGKARFDFIARPGANPAAIKLKIDGASQVSLASPQDLVMATSLGSVRNSDLKAYQEIGGRQVPVEAAYQLSPKNEVSFKLGRYDARYPVVIDPLVYGSYYGGDSGFDEVYAVTADADFGVFSTGYTQAVDFPAVAGPFSWNVNGVRDAFVSKFQGDAYSHDYSAFIGGSSSDVGQYIGLSPDGNQVWICGTTTSNDLPGINGNSFRNAISGASDIFMMRFSKSDTQVLVPDYATYYGSAGSETLRGMAVAPVTGEIVVVGTTNGGLPVMSNAYLGGTSDAFMTRFNVNTVGITGVKHGFYVGGVGNDACGGVAVDLNDNVVMTGSIPAGAVVDTSVDASNYDTTPGVFSGGRLLRFTDVFVRKYSSAGILLYSALVGGNGTDTSAVGGTFTGSPVSASGGVAVDPAGNAYITGIARSFNFPRTRDVYGENVTAAAVIFVTKLNQDASEIVYSTHLNTTGAVTPSGIAVDSRGTAYVSGVVGFGLSFPNPPADPNEPTGVQFGAIPTTADALDPTYESPQPPELPTTEGFLLALTPTATNLLYGTYIGGILDEQLYGPYVDRFGDVWVNGGMDVGRFYQRVSSMGVVTNYLPTGPRTATIPTALLSPFAFKVSPDPASLLTATAVTTPYGSLGGAAPGTITALVWRDGILVKHRLVLPTITDISLNPPNVAGGLGATSQGNITLSGPVPSGGLDVTVTLNNAAASFSPGSNQDTLVINLPAGATNAQFTLYTSPVTSPTQVQVKGTLEGNFQIALLTVQPWLQQLSITPTSVVGGNNVTGRVTLWQNAITDTTIDLSTDASGLVDFPNGTTVTVPAGASSATFTIRTHGVGPQTDVPVTASLLGVGKTAFVRLLPASLQTVTFNPGRVTSGASSTGTVTLDGEAGPSFTVDLTLNAGTAGYSLNPTQITFNPGERSKTFTINTAFEPVNTQRIVTATRTAQGPYSLQAISGTIFVDAATLITFTVTPTTVDPGGTSTGTVTINSPAGTGGAPIDVTTDNPLATVSSPVLVPAGATSTSFPINFANVAVASDTVITVTATRGPVSIQQQITLRKSTASLTLNPGSVVGGNPSTATLSLASPAGTGGMSFTLVSSDPAATVPASATITDGNTSVNFTVTTTIVTLDVFATITATSGGISAQATLTIQAPRLVQLVFQPSRVRGLTPSSLKVTIDTPAPVGGAVIPLTSSNPLAANVPSSITILAGTTTRTVTVPTRRVSRVLATQVTATYGSSTLFAVLTVTR